MQTVSILSPSTSEEVQQSAESDLELLSRSLSAAPQEEPENSSVAPPVPETLEDTGLTVSVLQQLILKKMYSRGDMLGRELSEGLGLKFSLIEAIIEFLKRQHFMEAKKSLGMGSSTVLYALTDTGKTPLVNAWRAISTPVRRRFRWRNTRRWCGGSGARMAG